MKVFIDLCKFIIIYLFPRFESSGKDVIFSIG